MPYVQIPKDLTKVKTKVALNLTKRQLVCFSGAAATGIPFYLLTRGLLGNSVAAVGMILLMLPWMAFALYEKDGQPLEKILMNIIQTRFVRKRVRPYATQNFYSYLNDEVKKNKEVTAIATANATAGKNAKTTTGPARAGKNK